MKLILSLLLAGALVAPAAAQRYDGEGFSDDPDQAIGTRFKRAPETASQSEAREMQRRVARCVYDRHDELSQKILAHSDFRQIDFAAIGVSPDELFDELNVPRCIERAMKHSTYSMRMRIQFATLRNLLAEEAYLDEFDEPVAVPAGSPVTLTNRYRYETMGPRTTTIAQLADCIIHTDPAGADAFLRERPGTDGEGEAIENLSGALGKCLGSEAPPEVGASMMRQVVADGLWSRGYYGPTAAAAAVSEVTEAD